MGLRRGTILGLTGVAGALIEQQFGIIGSFLIHQFGIGPKPLVVGWGLGCFFGVIAGDIATAVTGQEVNFGKLAGIKKGLIASVVAVLGYYLSTTGVVGDLLAGSLRRIPLLTSADTIKIVSIWLGGVLGDFFDA